MFKIMQNELLGEYINGNYKVSIYSDGTKIRETLDENATEFLPDYPESMDVKICNKCDMGCKMCHENSTPEGKLGDILNARFFDTLMPYTEIALGGGNTLEHTDLIPFLKRLKKLNLIPNMTVNQVHFMKNKELLFDLCEKKLIYGLGVSLVEVTEEFIKEVKKLPNAVIHIINGMVTKEELKKLENNNLALLILGYKEFRRGSDLYELEHERIETGKSMLKSYLPEMLDKFRVVSFDNLAISQLNVKSLLSEEDWNSFYMGDEGSFTMYVDLVEQNYAICSVSTERFPLLDDIKPMFSRVRKLSK